MSPQFDAVAQAERWSTDLTSFEYKEQIRAAREMQHLGVAAAPYAKALAGRLDDPRYQIRRACAEVLRMLAESAKELALDAAVNAPTIEIVKPSGEQSASTIEVVKPLDEQSAPTIEVVKPSDEHSVPNTVAQNEAVSSTPRLAEGSEHAPEKTSEPTSTTGETETNQPSKTVEARNDSKQTPHPSIGEAETNTSLSEMNEAVNGSVQAPHPSTGEMEINVIPSESVEATNSNEQAPQVPLGGLDVVVTSPPPTATTLGTMESDGLHEPLEETVEEEDTFQITPRAQARADPRAAVLPYVGKLVAAMKDSRWQVRQSAALALAALGGEEVAEYLTDILEVLSDEHAEVRCAAAMAIEAVGPLAAKHARTLMEHINDISEEMRVQVVKAVAALGRKIEAKLKHVDVLINFMKSDVAYEVRLAAINALRCQGRAVIPFFPTFRDVVLDDSSRWVRHAALDLLCDFSFESATQIASLLESKELDVQRRVARKIGQLATDLCDSDHGNRRDDIAQKVAVKVEEQNKYFAAKKEVKRKAKIMKMRETGLEVDSDSDIDISDTEMSEEPLMDADLEEQANQELVDAVASYVIALAGFLDDADEDLRKIASDALKCVGAVKHPYAGKQFVVWQDGKWLLKPCATQREEMASETVEDS